MAGQTVLIHGVAGGVGVFAAQLARWAGVQVIATASARNRDFLRELGANEIINYTTTRFEDVVHDVDLVFDTVKESIHCLEQGMVSNFAPRVFPETRGGNDASGRT